MSNEPFTIKTGDTSPSLLYVLDPAPSTLAGATVVFNMKDDACNVIINRASAYVETESPPTLGYDFTALQTANSGTFFGEFEVTYADASIGTWPNKGFIPIAIGEDIG